MSDEPDFDQLVRAGALDDDVDPAVAANRARHEAMWEEYYAALLADIEYVIELAGAASAIANGERPPTPLALREREAAKRAQPKVEKVPKAPRVKLSPDEKTKRQRESKRRSAEKRREAVAAAAQALPDPGAASSMTSER